MDSKRHNSDRRASPTPLWNKFFLRGRRRGTRRATEEHQVYVDQPGAMWVLMAIILLIAGAADAYLTNYGLSHAMIAESNPLMLVLMETIGYKWTWIIKLLLTGVGVWLLLSHGRWRWGKIGLVILCVFYVSLMAIHLWVILYGHGVVIL